jgi:hypothetical protein
LLVGAAKPRREQAAALRKLIPCCDRLSEHEGRTPLQAESGGITQAISEADGVGRTKPVCAISAGL